MGRGVGVGVRVGGGRGGGTYSSRGRKEACLCRPRFLIQVPPASAV